MSCRALTHPSYARRYVAVPRAYLHERFPPGVFDEVVRDDQRRPDGALVYRRVARQFQALGLRQPQAHPAHTQRPLEARVKSQEDDERDRERHHAKERPADNRERSGRPG